MKKKKEYTVRIESDGKNLSLKRGHEHVTLYQNDLEDVLGKVKNQTQFISSTCSWLHDIILDEHDETWFEYDGKIMKEKLKLIYKNYEKEQKNKKHRSGKNS